MSERLSPFSIVFPGILWLIGVLPIVAVAAPADPKLTATIDVDTGAVLLTVTDPTPAADTASYQIVRELKPDPAPAAPKPSTLDNPKTLILQKPKPATAGAGFAGSIHDTMVDVSKNAYIYTVYAVKANGDRSITALAPAITTAVTPLATPLLTRTRATIKEFEDTSQWRKLLPTSGNWYPDTGNSYVQASDPPPPPDNSKISDTKSLWLGTPVGVKAQLSAVVQMTGWEKFAGTAQTPVPNPLPLFQIGIGFSTNNVADKDRSAIYLGIQGILPSQGDLKDYSAFIIDENGNSSLLSLNLDSLGWKIGDKIHFKLKIEHVDKSSATTTSFKIWKDGSAEPDTFQRLSTPGWNWPLGTGTTPVQSSLYPALLGSVRARGNQDVKVTFSEVTLEYIAPPVASTTSNDSPIPPLVGPTLPTLKPPAMSDDVFIPKVALTSSPLFLTRWGTAMGVFECEGPIPLRVEQTRCPLVIPRASKPPRCDGSCRVEGRSGCAACVSTGFSAPIFEELPTTENQVPAPILSTPGPSPFAPEPTTSDSRAITPVLEPLPTLSAAVSSPTSTRPKTRAIRASDPGNHRVEGSSRDQTVRRISLAVDEPQMPVVSIPIDPTPLPESAGITPRNSTLTPPASTQARVNRQSLRDFGAVATVPDPSPNASDGDKVAIETLLKALLIASGSQDPNAKAADRLAYLISVYPAIDGMNISTTVKTVVKKALKEEMQKLFNSDPNFEHDNRKVSEAYRNLLSPKAAAPPFGPPPSPLLMEPRFSGSMPGDDGENQSRDPFSYQPKVTVVQDSSSPEEDALDADTKGNSYFLRRTRRFDELLDDEKLGRVWTYHFDLPARFATPKFSPQPLGQPCAWEGEGTVIHEGMRLRVRQDGQYEVRFNATSPSIPVLLRLQLVLYITPDRTARTITLPPILMQPTGASAFPNDLEAGVDPTSYIVNVRGYSQVLKEAHVKETDHMLLVKRIGSARVGSGVRYQANP